MTTTLIRRTGGGVLLVPAITAIYTSSAQGTWIRVLDSGGQFFGYIYNSTATDGDKFTQQVYLPRGTYSLLVGGFKLSTGGIVDIDIDGSEVASFDRYNAGTVGVINTQPSISVSEGFHDIRFRLDGKHASSSGYRFYCSHFAFELEAA